MGNLYKSAGDIAYAPEADPDSVFAVDKHINIETIDDYLGIEGVAYRDVRMLDDSARFEDVGGDHLLTTSIEGFEEVPFPYLVTVGPMPIGGAYTGDSLFSATWESEKQIGEVKANYEESLAVLEQLFPKDQTIFIMCGAGGYAGMTRSLLVKLGWDEKRLYNVGGCWKYEGDHSVTVVESADDGTISVNADAIAIHKIAFDELTPVAKEG